MVFGEFQLVGLVFLPLWVVEELIVVGFVGCFVGTYISSWIRMRYRCRIFGFLERLGRAFVVGLCSSLRVGD